MAKRQNERLTEKIFEDLLKTSNIQPETGWKIEYQKSENPKLQFISKTGKGGVGAPEFIITRKGCSNFAIIIEAKASVDKLEKFGKKKGELSLTESNIKSYAVNSALFYANQIHDDFNVLFIGCVGTTEDDFNYTMYFYDQQKDYYTEVLNHTLADFNQLKETVTEIRESSESPTVVKNTNLHKAKKEKNDEFYTQLSDIENELKHYKEHFKNKIVYCNCDDHKWSNFFQYFSMNFEQLGLKKLISTHFDAENVSYKLEIVRDENGDGKIDHLDTIETPLKQNGDFRSPECIELLKEADIVVTNPPFSLFREFIAQLMEYEKKFLILGNNNTVVNHLIFNHIKNNKLWLGVSNNKTMEFRLHNTYEKWDKIDENGNKYGKVPAISWFTNLEHNKRNEQLILYKSYNSKEYPIYDNYNAINVDKVKEIPMDYDGVMGVPITFLDKWNPDQFEILGMTNNSKEITYGLLKENIKIGYATWASINGKNLYARLLIKKKIKK